MEVGEQLRYVCELCKHRGTRGQRKKSTVSWWLRERIEEVILHFADMAIAAQIVSHGSILPQLRRPDSASTYKEALREAKPHSGQGNGFRHLRGLLQSTGCHMFCAECEAITTELGEVYAEAWFSCDEKTKEIWLAVYGMIGGTEDDAEKAEEVTRGLELPGRGYTGFPKANRIGQVLQRKFAHEARSRHKIGFPPGH